MRMLVCPACESPMTEVSKNGVLIDTCTKCRGVWLDRGELEKLATMVDPGSLPGPTSGFLGQAPGFLPRGDETRYRRDDDHDDDDDDRRRRRDGYSSAPPKSKMSRLMDFFD